MATLVPTPSVEVASSGRVVRLQRGGVEEPGEAADAAEHLGPLRRAATDAFISSTARSPASTSTPAAA